MIVDTQEFVWEFSQPSCPGQTRKKVAWEFSQLSCRGQTRTRVVWDLMRVDKRLFALQFFNYHYLVKCKQELHAWMRNFSRVLIKQEQELNESWEARSCMFSQLFYPIWSWEFLTLMSWLNKNKNKSWWELTKQVIGWELFQTRTFWSSEKKVAWELIDKTNPTVSL